MAQNLVVTVTFISPADMPAKVAALEGRTGFHRATGYQPEAVAYASEYGVACDITMPAGVINPWLLLHEFDHCVGRRHDEQGRWLPEDPPTAKIPPAVSAGAPAPD